LKRDFCWFCGRQACACKHNPNPGYMVDCYWNLKFELRVLLLLLLLLLEPSNDLHNKSQARHTKRELPEQTFSALPHTDVSTCASPAAAAFMYLLSQIKSAGRREGGATAETGCCAVRGCAPFYCRLQRGGGGAIGNHIPYQLPAVIAQQSARCESGCETTATHSAAAPPLFAAAVAAQL
jgi:hypothetical protein